MQNSSAKNSIPGGNPIANALVIVAGVLAIGASIVLGFFAFITLGAIILVCAAIIGLRVWWLNRKAGRRPHAERRSAGRRAADRVIEGEYRVVHKDDDET